ncbi:MAG: 3-hydroxyacyl-CoA dehydrogenase NAD-binding domain-containing protein [Bacteroidota bacterium]
MAKYIAVIGAGTIGKDIARAIALAQIDVMLYDINDTILRRSIETIKEDLQQQVKQKTITGDELKALVGRIRPKTELKALGHSDIVIETTHEDMRVKKDLFKKLEDICRLNTILATNSSSLSITAIASVCKLRHKIVGMHFFHPAHIMKLVEVVRGSETSDVTVKAVVELATRMGKTPVVVGDTPGLIVDRIQRLYFGEALRLLNENVATAEEIDRIVRLEGGFSSGPFMTLDQIGIDTDFALTQSIYNQYYHTPRYRPHPLQKKMVEAGMLGVKTEIGFFKHERRFKV